MIFRVFNSDRSRRASCGEYLVSDFGSAVTIRVMNTARQFMRRGFDFTWVGDNPDGRAAWTREEGYCKPTEHRRTGDISGSIFRTKYFMEPVGQFRRLRFLKIVKASPWISVKFGGVRRRVNLNRIRRQGNLIRFLHRHRGGRMKSGVIP